MQLGLCTYNWGADWDLTTVIKNCQLTGFKGVELRTQQKHGVETSLNSQERKDVARRFGDSGVELVGLGSTCEYHSPDAGELKKQIDETKAFIMLCHDCGGGGVKVRPNALPKDVSVDKTVEQIGKALNEVAEFGQGYGVQIRLEVHGKGTNEVPICKKIMDVADHPNATVCWNCNDSDMNGAGLDANFKSLQNRLGTIHIHDLITKYPWVELFALLKGAKFDGWTLVEEGKTTSDPIRVMQYYRLLWQTMAT
ncbi:MAG TPA: TIM barrel protein [Pirellulales bacterium]|jgi:sugar phosphate isomerase/epimerase|nr:TIM barrel protein [Pirellulales bacterium]